MQAVSSIAGSSRRYRFSADTARESAPPPSRVRELLPGPFPTWRVAVAGGFLALIGIALATRVDVSFATWVRDHPLSFVAKQFLETSRWPGNYLFTILLAGMIAAWSRDGWVGRARAALLLIAAGVPSLMSTVVKWGVGRTRPFRGAAAFGFTPMHDGLMGVFTQKNLSFPSGDATLAFATAAAIAVMFPRLRGPAFLWAAIVAVARVLQGAHYPSDVLAGMALGTGMSWAILAIVAVADRSGDDRPWPTASETLALRR